MLFPPAPIALVDSKNGGVQRPRAGVLGSKDSLTGAPEKYRGEAVEQEASNLVNSVAGVAIGSAAGKHDPAVPDDASMEDKIPDVTDVASKVGDLQDSASGAVPTHKHDKTNKPVSDAVWTKMKPIMHVLGNITDTYERFGKYVSFFLLFLSSDQMLTSDIARCLLPRLSPSMQLVLDCLLSCFLWF